MQEITKDKFFELLALDNYQHTTQRHTNFTVHVFECVGRITIIHKRVNVNALTTMNHLKNTYHLGL